MGVKNFSFVILAGFFMQTNSKAQQFTLESTAFKHNAPIPALYTCDGKNISPELHWTDVPDTTKSFVLIVDDPDAPGNAPFVHWVLFNIPATTRSLSQDIQNGDFIQAKTSFGVNKYGGPCPPSGTHHYHFKLYALDTIVDLTKDATKHDVLNALEGRVIGQAQLIGLYKRQ